MRWGEVLVLCGLGGMGKTQYAVQHAHEARTTYSNVLWAFADTPDTLRTSLAALCQVPELGISMSSDATLIEKIREVKRWLQNSINWLLILDNADSVDSAKAIERILPPVHRGRVIITARITEWSSAFNVQPIDAWAEAQSVQFLMQRLGGREQDRELLAKLAETLGGLPLALEQASAYILQTRVRVTEYLATFGTNRRILLARKYSGMTDYRASVATTWQVSIGRLGVLSRYILNIVAFFAPDPIPRSIFRELRSAVSVYLHSPMELRILRRALSASNAVDLALAELATYSLLSLSEETCRAHPLLQTVVRDSARPEARIFFSHVLRWFYHFPNKKAWREALWPLRAASFLNREGVLPSPEGDAVAPRLGEYVPHIEAILTYLPKSLFGSFVDPAQLHSIVSNYREHLAGVATLRSILEDRLKHLPEVRRELQWFLENLDDFLERVPKEAGGGEPQIFWSLRFLTTQNKGHRLQNAYRIIDNLADAQASTGETATAQRLFHLLIMLTSSGPDADACAAASVRLAEANALWKCVPREETLQLLANGLAIFERENNLQRGDVFNGIQLYTIFAQTDDEKWRACQWLRQAIPLAEEYLKYGGGYACGLVFQLAQIATDCKIADEALATCEDILRAALRCPKLRRQELGLLWHARALLLGERGTFLSAARCYVRSLAMERHDPSLTTFRQAQLLKEAAEMFCKAERPAMSIRLLLESASLLDKGWDKEAANIEMLAALTGLELGRLGQIPAGEKLLRRSIASRAERHGDNSSTLWAPHRLLGLFLHDAGRLLEAEAQLRRALAILEMHPPVCNQTLARILTDLVALLVNMERDDEALLLLKRWSQLGEHVAGELV